jgi:hypothetical protein
MNNFFSEIGIPALDFIEISVLFLLTMLVFFTLKNKRTFWINYLLLTTFVLQCVLVVVFHDGLRVKAFAFLMLISVLVIEGLTSRKKKLGSSFHSAAK